MVKRIFYAQATFGWKEKYAVVRSLSNRWLAAGKKVEEFEKIVAKKHGKKYALATNSGSSANLLAISALGLPQGSEVITPACTFATTVAPLIQNGLLPVFVDTTVGRYTIDENLVEKAITKKTKAIMVPQLIGSLANMPKLREIANRYGLYLIDDSCDTFGALYKNKPLGKFSDITTTSFYGSHIITTLGSGGILMTDNKEILQRARSLANWGRVGTDTEAFDKRFNYAIDGIAYDEKFIYDNIGYNVKMTEAAAAFGLEQLKRLKKFGENRIRNFNSLSDYFSQYEEMFYVPRFALDHNFQSIPLAFPLAVKKTAPFTRYEFLKHLDKNGIQIRILFSGNITRHPAYKHIKYRISGTLKNSDVVMESGLLIGCHQGLSQKDIAYIKKVCDAFLATKFLTNQL